MAARVHAHQRRKDGITPYAAHPFRVAMTVRDLFGCDDQETLAIALLHDTIEDTTTDFDDIAADFGPTVAAGVAALTKLKTLREDIREEEYDGRIAAADWRVRLVKLADTFDNLCDLDGIPGPEREARRGRLVARCQRAISLASRDAGDHPETARALALLRELLSSST
jgi:(p)ppGpp synthase/HD superfamily hydrolase